MPIEFKTRVGRIVWGHPLRSQTKKHQDGPNRGQPVLRDGKQVEQWAFGVAFPKNEFLQFVYPHLEQEARAGYPNGVPPRFSWKFVDGDGVDSTGQPYNQREGYAGCYVLTISTEAFAPPVFKFNQQTQQYVQLKLEEIKTGDYVVVGLNIKVNVATGTNTPSLYVNPTVVELVGYGTEIMSRATVDPVRVLGRETYQLPPGASAVPTMPQTNVAMPGTGQPMPMQQPGYPQPQPMQQPQIMPQQPMQQPGYPQQPAPQMMPQQMPPPAHDFVQQAGYPQPGNAPVQNAGYPSMPTGQAPMPTGHPAPAAFPSNQQPQMMPQQPMQPMQQPGYPQQMPPGMMPPR